MPIYSVLHPINPYIIKKRKKNTILRKKKPENQKKIYTYNNNNIRKEFKYFLLLVHEPIIRISKIISKH